MELLLSIDMLLVAGRKRVQLALPVGSRSFRHFCGKDRMVMMVRMKGEERREKRETSKKRKGKVRQPDCRLYLQSGPHHSSSYPERLLHLRLRR
jgi:hypothetical protein